MSFYKYHVFICTNQRQEGEVSCNALGGSDAFTYAKNRVSELGLNGPGAVRINKAGCLGRCDQGPLMVIYPEETWYSYVDNDDIEEIIQKHLRQGQVVERLKI